MDHVLYERISGWFDGHQEALLRDIMRLVRIPSVSRPQAGERPFGQGCAEALDTMLAIGRENGFHVENYDYRVGSIGRRAKDWSNLIGLWNHLDVVPAGEGWRYKPFDPVLRENFLIGRGSRDNKGPAVGMLYVMRCLRELEAPMKHELCLFVGCDEERGMEDLTYYTQRYPLPALSMVADSGFPVCYGEKGIHEGRMVSRAALSEDILGLEGGTAGNMIPETARAVIRDQPGLEEELRGRGVPAGREGGAICVTAKGSGGHSAFPEGCANAAHELCALLGSLDSLCPGDRRLFEDAAYLTEEYEGKHTGAAYRDEISGRTTCAATSLSIAGRKLSLGFNIRYAVSDRPERLKGALVRAAGERGFDWYTDRDSAPNCFPREHPAVDLLTGVYNELTGEAAESFVMGGGTYARKLPNAFAYGIGGMRETPRDRELKRRLFAPGHGGAHEPDEALNVRLFLEAMKIYAAALAAMNDCPLSLPGRGRTGEPSL